MVSTRKKKEGTMGHKNREIEIKMLIQNKDVSWREAVKRIESLFGKKINRVIYGNSSDYYWATPRKSQADFVRVREFNGRKEAQVTVKCTDSGSNFDRVEVDLMVADRKQAEILLNFLMGQREGAIKKKYNVYFLDKHETNVSLYQIEGSPHIFIEVEARSQATVIKICDRILHDGGFALSRVKNSLYDIFVRKNVMQVRTLTAGALKKTVQKVSKKSPNRKARKPRLTK